ncbi:MAG: histidinol dehydrogenase [Candidatus Bathyarchaeia archaeon]
MIKIKRIDEIEEEIRRLEERGGLDLGKVMPSVEEIVEDVKKLGDDAISRYTKKYDKVDLKKEEFKVSDEEIIDAYKKIDKSTLKAIRKCIKNIESFQRKQLREFWFTKIDEGILAGQFTKAIESVGIYVPGGRASYVSTVLMTAVPAKVAGVGKIIICTPPNLSKKIDPGVLVASKEVGVTSIYKVGGAQAIAAMAFGTEIIPKVDKVIGPGNIYVTAAKILVSREVAIDFPAGPSEILILADETASPGYIAADLISQAEHDPEALAILITSSEELAKAVLEEINSMFRDLGRKEIVQASLRNKGMIIVSKNIGDSIELINRIAPEHLQIMTKNPLEIVEKITNAGAIFIGDYSPCALGDYSAGVNHVLPTSGYARIYSGLSIKDFMKVMDVLYCTEEGYSSIADSAAILAKQEGLEGHAKAILLRLSKLSCRDSLCRG